MASSTREPSPTATKRELLSTLQGSSELLELAVGAGLADSATGDIPLLAPTPVATAEGGGSGGGGASSGGKRRRGEGDEPPAKSRRSSRSSAAAAAAAAASGAGSTATTAWGEVAGGAGAGAGSAGAFNGAAGEAMPPGVVVSVGSKGGAHGGPYGKPGYKAAAARVQQAAARDAVVQRAVEHAAPKRKRGRVDKASKGLRHFALKVCEKVEEKMTTSYNEVADELVQELTLGGAPTPGFDEKNIRRRVYDALNVLMAMDIITKEKKEVKWRGLPSNSEDELASLQRQKAKLEGVLATKRESLAALLRTQVAQRKLLALNRKRDEETPVDGRIHLPFIIVSTSDTTTIELEMDTPERRDLFFSFTAEFQINDDNEIARRMGLDRATVEELQLGNLLDEDVREFLIEHDAERLVGASAAAESAGAGAGTQREREIEAAAAMLASAGSSVFGSESVGPRSRRARESAGARSSPSR